MRTNATGQPEISVIMGVFNPNSKKQLLDAVQSILRQTFRDFELLICDDGSDAKQSAWIYELRTLDERVRVIRNTENRGLAFSLNRCIERATGKYLARMDADDIALPDRLAREYAFLEAHSEYDWVGCSAVLFDDAGIWGRTTRPKMPEQKDFLRFSPYIHPTVMFRQSVFENAEGYSEADKARRCEDYELFARLHYAGLRGFNLREELLYYRVDRYAYHKRPFRERLNETIVRYRLFLRLGILFPAGWIFALRPIAAMVVPHGILARVKGNEA